MGKARYFNLFSYGWVMKKVANDMRKRFIYLLTITNLVNKHEINVTPFMSLQRGIKHLSRYDKIKPHSFTLAQ